MSSDYKATLINLLSLAVISAAISSDFGRDNCFNDATLVVAITKDTRSST